MSLAAFAQLYTDRLGCCTDYCPSPGSSEAVKKVDTGRLEDSSPAQHYLHPGRDTVVSPYDTSRRRDRRQELGRVPLVILQRPSCLRERRAKDVSSRVGYEAYHGIVCEQERNSGERQSVERKGKRGDIPEKYRHVYLTSDGSMIDDCMWMHAERGHDVDERPPFFCPSMYSLSRFSKIPLEIMIRLQSRPLAHPLGLMALASHCFL